MHKVILLLLIGCITPLYASDLIESNPKSRQIKISEVNHFFTDMGEPLLEVVVDWLEKL